MSLICGCDYGFGDYDWYWYEPEDYKNLDTKRSRKCRSCGNRIAVGDLCIEFTRAREARDDLEARIWGDGDAISLASWYFCEDCADQWFNLDELGFCVNPSDDMREMLEEYQEMKAVFKQLAEEENKNEET